MAIVAVLSGTTPAANVSDEDVCLVVSAENIVTGQGNWYLYTEISNRPYTIVAGDHLEYDVLLPSLNPELRGGVDGDLKKEGLPAGASGHTELRECDLKDEGGLRLHGATDLPAARDKWYHRRFDLSALAGATVERWMIVFEGDLPGRYIQFLHHIQVKRDGQEVFTVFHAGPAPEAKVRLNNGYSREVLLATAPFDGTLNDKAVGEILARARAENQMSIGRAQFRAEIDLSREVCRQLKDETLATEVEMAARGEDAAAFEAKDAEKYLASLQRARQGLVRFQPEMARYTGHLVGHAHIDFQWLWPWDETVRQIIPDTFGQAVKFMQEFPEFTFSQSSAGLYFATEQHHPELFEQMQEYAKQGRWEPVGGRWAEGDLNMIAPESHVRHYLYGQRYFQEKFGQMCQDAWEPDTFGHPWTMPQILQKAGIRSYYFCRAGKGKPLFWWEGPDGSRLLAFDEEAMKSWYIGVVNDDKVRMLARFAALTGLRDYLMVYGVGNHGGGPTRENIVAAMAMKDRRPWPTIKFSTLRGFWDAALAQADASTPTAESALAGLRTGRGPQEGASASATSEPSPDRLRGGRAKTADVHSGELHMPVIASELNSVFEGCYTSHSLIKKYNRDSEVLLTSAEVWATLAAIRKSTDSTYPRADFTQLWRDVLWNHHHDTICGSCIHPAAEYSHKMYAALLRHGNEIVRRSQQELAARFDVSGGPLIVVFNPLAWERSDVVEVEVPVSESAMITDVDGDVPTQHLQSRISPAPAAARVCFLARNVPACGFKVFGLRPAPAPGIGGALREVGTQTPESQARLQILHEKPRGMSAWEIGEIDRTTELEKPVTWTTTEEFPVRQRVVSIYEYGQSKITQEKITYAHTPRVDYETTVEWGEVGNPKDGSEMLKVAFKTGIDAPVATYDIPFGDVARKTDGHENAALKWCDLSGPEHGLTLLNDCKHGYDVKGGVIRLTLLRSSYEPDPKPDVGTHHMRYAVLPHEGPLDKAAVARAGWEFNYPMRALVLDARASETNRAPSASAGDPGRSWSGCEAKPASIIVTALKLAEDNDDMILRAYECAGKPVTATFTLGFDAKNVAETDLLERRMKDAGRVKLAGRAVTAEFKPYEIRTLRIRR